MWCSLGFWYKSNAVCRNVFFPAVFTYITFPAWGHLGSCELEMHKWHSMGNVCNKKLFQFLLPSIDEMWAPCGNQPGWREWGQLPYAGGEQPLTWLMSRSDSAAQPVLGRASFMMGEKRSCSLADFSLACFPDAEVEQEHTCLACITLLFFTLETPYQQLQLSKLESLKFKADWERSSPVLNSTSWPLCGSGKHRRAFLFC